MLYVFHVDTGRMIKFDMNVALSSVQNLKDMIERLHGLPATNIVLLVSGGEMLTPGSLVCSYSAGTDTNPIYMFSTVDVKPQPWPSIESEVDLKEQVDRCLSLPATYSTVVARAQLAQQIYDFAREEEAICERLVHEQHLQQQGWSAVIANMEDLTDEFRQRFDNFCKCFVEHLRKRSEYLELLDQFNDDVDKLSRIPILPGLMQNAEEEFHGFDDYLNNDEIFSRSQQNVSIIAATTSNQSHKFPFKMSKNEGIAYSNETKSLVLTKIEKTENNDCSGEGEGDDQQLISANDPTLIKNRTLTLLQWISAKENHAALKIMAEECMQGLATFDEDKFENLKYEVLNIIKVAEQEEIKEIKGLEDRLCGLEKLMYELRKYVQEQKELSTAFQQNQNRASNLGDASILPDLCASHRSQLVVMLHSHKVIRDIRRRISRAKDELGANLDKRLKYIVHIENTMSELDNNLLFYHRCLRRVERHLNIIQQIHQTPSIYVSAVTEVVRRRIFSGEFINWASNLACDFSTIHNEEVLRRQEFNTNFEGHFLNALFPGMNDMPPAFANETPIVFDAGLPNITKSDLDILSSYLPDIASKTQFPDMGPVIDFFVSRSGLKNILGKSSITYKSQSNTTIPAITHRPIDLHAHLKDGFESETDTEEFEKVGQSSNEQQSLATLTTTMATSTTENIPLMTNVSTSMETIKKNTVETLTEENLGSTRLEVEKLKTSLKLMSLLSTDSIQSINNDIKTLRQGIIDSKTQLQSIIIELLNAWNRIKLAYNERENELKETLKNKHEIEINELKRNLTRKIEDNELLINDKIIELVSQNNKIQNLELERDSLKAEISRLSKQIENLQQSLNVVEIEKEKAIAECREHLIHEHKTEIESLRCRFKLMTSMESSPSDTSLEKIGKQDFIDTDLGKKILEELDTLRERESFLIKENSQLKLKIGLITSEDESEKIWKEKLDILNKNKLRLEEELMKEKSKRIEMETSFAAMKSSAISRDVTGSPDLNSTRSSKISSSQTATIASGKYCITMDSCVKGDTVFVLWNMKHGQYMVLQDSSSLYFVHGDSINGLNLKLPNPGETDMPTTLYCIAKVLDKEYCQARKDENRYRVTKGTKFYRVKLQTIAKPEISRSHHKRDRFESTSSSTSVSRSMSTQHLIDSFAQTEASVISSSLISSSQQQRDTVDCVTITPGIFKERTMSVCSVAEEDDERISVLSERCRYISLSEEDEKDSATTNTIITSVVSSSTSTTTLLTTSSTNLHPQEQLQQQQQQLQLEQQISATTTTENSSEKDQDDSDEYRSLEVKDEFDFPA